MNNNKKIIARGFCDIHNIKVEVEVISRSREADNKNRI